MRLEVYNWLLPWRSQQVAHVFRALKSPNYRWYFGCNGLSLIGTWMQRLALSWLVYRLTGSALLLGAIDFCWQFTAFLMMPLAGVILDNFNLRKFLMLTQLLGGLQAGVLAFLTLTDRITFPQLVVLSIFHGVINAFDMPGRQSIAVKLVTSKSDLSNAIALNSSLFNSARLLGPSIAGVVVANFGEGICFLLNAISFIPILFAFSKIEISGTVKPREGLSVKKSLKEGLLYAFSHKVIRPILFMLALTSFIGMSYLILLPIFAKEILHGGPDTLGFLTGATGMGALFGALYLASRTEIRGLVRGIPLGFGFFGVAIIFFAWSENLYFSILLLAITGFCMICGWAACNTLLQAVVDDDKRARIMSLYMMSFMGTAPLGSLLMGYLSQTIGPQTAVTLGGALCVFGAAAFFRFGPSENMIVPQEGVLR